MAVTHTLRGFKTAYLQKEEVMDVAVFSTETNDYFKVGQVVNLTAASGTTPAYISKDATPAVGDYIVAQSDMTMEYGHVPVENRDYRYEAKVAVTEATAMDATSVYKKVALFKITNLNDIVSL